MLILAILQYFVSLVLCMSITGRYHEKEELIAHNDSGIMQVNVSTAINQETSSSPPLDSSKGDSQDQYDEIDMDLEKYKESLHNRLKQMKEDRAKKTQPEISKAINETDKNETTNEQVFGNMSTPTDYRKEINNTQDINRTENVTKEILNLPYPSHWYHLINKNGFGIEITILNLLKDMENDEDKHHSYDYSDISKSLNTPIEPPKDVNHQPTMNIINIHKSKKQTYGNEDTKSLNESKEMVANNEIDTNQNDQNKTVSTENNESKESPVTRDIEIKIKNEPGNENKTNSNKEEESDIIIKGPGYRQMKMDNFYSPQQYINETNDDTLHDNTADQKTEKKKEESGIQELKSPKSNIEIENKTNEKLSSSASVTYKDTSDKESSNQPIVESETTSPELYATELPGLYDIKPSNKSNEEEIKKLKTFQITPPNAYQTYNADQYSSTSYMENKTSTESEVIPETESEVIPEPESEIEDTLDIKPTKEPKSLPKLKQTQDSESRQTTQSLPDSKTTIKFKTDELSTENPKSIKELYSRPSMYSNAEEETTPQPEIVIESKSTKTDLILETGHTMEPHIKPNQFKNLKYKSLPKTKEISGLESRHTTKSLPLLSKTEPLSRQKIKSAQEAESTTTQYPIAEAITIPEPKSTKEKNTPEIEKVLEPENVSNQFQVSQLESESKQSPRLEPRQTTSLPETITSELKQINPLSKYSNTQPRTTLEPKSIPEPNSTKAIPEREKAQESKLIPKQNKTPKPGLHSTPEPELIEVTELTEETTEFMTKEPDLTVNPKLNTQQPSSSVSEPISKQALESKSSQSENYKLSIISKNNQISNVLSTTMPEPTSTPEFKQIYPVLEQKVKSIPGSELTPLIYSKIEPKTTPEPKFKAEPESTEEKITSETKNVPEPEPEPTTKPIQTTKSHLHTTPESELIDLTKPVTEWVTTLPQFTVSPELKVQQPPFSKSEEINEQTSKSSQSNNYKLASTSIEPLENQEMPDSAPTILPVPINPVSAFLTSQKIKTHLTPEAKLKQETENISYYIENKTVMNYSTTTLKPSQDLELSYKYKSIEDNQKLNNEFLNNIGSFNYAYNHHKVNNFSESTENNLNHKNESSNETKEISKMENNDEKLYNLTTIQKSDYKMKNSESVDSKVKPSTDILYEMNVNLGTDLSEGTLEERKQKNVNVPEILTSNDNNNNNTLKPETIFIEADIFQSTSVASENENLGTELSEGMFDDMKQNNVNVSKISYQSLIPNDNTTLKSETISIEADVIESTSVASDIKQMNTYEVSSNTPQVVTIYKNKRFPYSHSQGNSDNLDTNYDFEDNYEVNSDLTPSTPNKLKKKLIHNDDLTTPMGLTTELLHYDDISTPMELQKESLPCNDSTTQMNFQNDEVSTPMELLKDDTSTPKEIQKELLHYDDSNYISKKSNLEGIDYSELDTNLNSQKNSSKSTEHINKYNLKNSNLEDNFSSSINPLYSSQFKSLESPTFPVQNTAEKKKNIKPNPDEANIHHTTKSGNKSKHHINDEITTVSFLYTTRQNYREPTPIELDYVQDQPAQRNTKNSGS